MPNINIKSMFILGVFIFFGLSALGYFTVESVKVFKQYDRTVVVKGLSQKDYKADIVLWPIKFVTTNNDLITLNNSLDSYTKEVLLFLEKNGIEKEEISIQAPSIIDKLANEYSNKEVKYRFYGTRTLNIYSKNVEKVRNLILKITELNKKGIIFQNNDYDTKVEYLFTKLNEIKPIMIEESTKNARAVAMKFAKDSNSKLGKIKNARQGQFSIYNRDKNTLHIKTVRVVSTVEYYLDD